LGIALSRGLEKGCKEDEYVKNDELGSVPEGDLNFQALNASVTYGLYCRMERIERIKLMSHTHSAHTRLCRVDMPRAGCSPFCSKIKMREMALCETHRVRMLKTQSPEIATWTDNSLLRTTTLMSPHACELACYLLSPSRICVRETDWLTP